MAININDLDSLNVFKQAIQANAFCAEGLINRFPIHAILEVVPYEYKLISAIADIIIQFNNNGELYTNQNQSIVVNVVKFYITNIRYYTIQGELKDCIFVKLFYHFSCIFNRISELGHKFANYESLISLLLSIGDSPKVTKIIQNYLCNIVIDLVIYHGFTGVQTNSTCLLSEVWLYEIDELERYFFATAILCDSALGNVEFMNEVCMYVKTCIPKLLQMITTTKVTTLMNILVRLEKIYNNCKNITFLKSLSHTLIVHGFPVVFRSYLNCPMTCAVVVQITLHIICIEFDETPWLGNESLNDVIKRYVTPKIGYSSVQENDCEICFVFYYLQYMHNPLDPEEINQRVGHFKNAPDNPAVFKALLLLYPVYKIRNPGLEQSLLKSLLTRGDSYLTYKLEQLLWILKQSNRTLKSRTLISWLQQLEEAQLQDFVTSVSSTIGKQCTIDIIHLLELTLDTNCLNKVARLLEILQSKHSEDFDEKLIDYLCEKTITMGSLKVILSLIQHYPMPNSENNWKHDQGMVKAQMLFHRFIAILQFYGENEMEYDMRALVLYSLRNLCIIWKSYDFIVGVVDAHLLGSLSYILNGSNANSCIIALRFIIFAIKIQAKYKIEANFQQTLTIYNVKDPYVLKWSLALWNILLSGRVSRPIVELPTPPLALYHSLMNSTFIHNANIMRTLTKLVNKYEACASSQCNPIALSEMISHGKPSTSFTSFIIAWIQNMSSISYVSDVTISNIRTYIRIALEENENDVHALYLLKIFSHVEHNSFMKQYY